jgi:hypothetical protein
MGKKRMDQEEETRKLLEEIRIGYAGRRKWQMGEHPSPREEQALKYLEPIDVTYVLLEHISLLELKIVRLICENAVLKEELKKEE